jgi:hypothetical protein
MHTVMTPGEVISALARVFKISVVLFIYLLVIIIIK